MCVVNTDIEEQCEDWFEPTVEEERILNKFYENNKLNLVFPTSEEGVDLNSYLWDSWSAMSEYLKDHVGELFYLCTVVSGDNDTAWIEKGRKLVDVIGYIISKKPFVIENEDIRYW